MYQYDDPTAIVSLPTPAAPGTAGYFTDGNPGAGQQATILRADYMNMLMMEVLNVVTAGGQAPSKTNYNQLLLAIHALIEARVAHFALDTGVANAYVIALSPAITAYQNGLTVYTRIVHGNTGACTLNAGGGAVPLVNDAGGALVAGDLPPGITIEAIYTADTGKFNLTSMTNSQAASGSTGITQAAGDARYAALAGLATQLFSVAKATAAAHAVRLDQVLGLGQTWTDMMAVRAPNVTYMNTTGKPIYLSASMSSTVNFIAEVYIDGVVHAWGANASATAYGAISAIVPDGSTYMITATPNNGVETMYGWSELR